MEFTDGVLAAEQAAGQLTYTLQYCFSVLASAIPVGVGLGFIPLIIGLALSGIVKIFKRI